METEYSEPVSPALTSAPARADDPDSAASSELFAGGGELGRRMREMNWAATPLGPENKWPQSLRTCIRIVLTSRQPMFVWWGDDLINLYNDAYRSILGGKHPEALGRPARLVWDEIWDQVGPRAESAMRANEGTYDESLLLMMERNGYREETYYTFSYSPVPNDQGGTGGIICANTDDTDRIISQRQIAALRDVAFRTADARNYREVCQLAAKSLESSRDVAFALIYISTENQSDLELSGSVRVAESDPAAPLVIRRDEGNQWPISESIRTNEIKIVTAREHAFPDTAHEDEQERVRNAAVVPISQVGNTTHNGILIVGLNPFRLPDDNYHGFLKMLSGQIAASVANAEAYEQERRRAESLAELDRAKTIFFSNVSHEFRTPLTLMLAPLEDMLEHRALLPAEDASNVETTHRNGMRLLKLVNTLLDFSRIEAGRLSACFCRLNLGEFTLELASVFRSATEKAGLRYVVECDCSDQATFVDPEMWEKIVLNLISNAFKFTLSGEIRVDFKYVDGQAELSIADTGAGISESELPRIFDRFHRVEGTIGRTHEGTGIGLALVSELARLHGGEVRVKSVLGAGSAFIVTLPMGRDHLPADKIAIDGEDPAVGRGSTAFVQEALRWLPEGASSVETLSDSFPEGEIPLGLEEDGGRLSRPRILLADDNRDMQEYLERLLSRRFDVTAVGDGEQALESALKSAPDLVLTDVMMPRMDGFALLRALRSHPKTAAIPIVMLSARAGEEAESEGLEAGADDYLVKPFTARELLARVQTHVTMHRLRVEMTAREQELRRTAEDAEYRYRSMLESISEAFLFVDRDWVIRYANRQYGALIEKDVESLPGRNLWEFFAGASDTNFGQAYRQAMDEGKTMRVEDYYAPMKKWFHVNAYPSAEGLSIFVMDVTERKEQEQKLLVTEKLAATGRLAATIAHEINNPLESVLNLIYLARTSRGKADETREYLTTAEREIARVSHIARHTLGFYRDTSQPARVELPRVVDEVLQVYESRMHGAGIELVKNYRPVPAVKGLRGEFHQVFSNALSNAIDAMPGGGRIEITLQEDPSGIFIRIADTGKGIPAENLSRAGEPFFTTKEGTGTGLGLWIIKQFVRGWGGTVIVTSSTDKDNHGTAISITLPRTIVPEIPRPVPSSQRVM